MTATIAPSPEIVAHVNREMLRLAISHQITCLTSGKVLDLCDAVMVSVPGGTDFVVTGHVWDERREAFTEQFPHVEVIDGRDL